MVFFNASTPVYEIIIKKINVLEPSLQCLNDRELRSRVQFLRKSINTSVLSEISRDLVYESESGTNSTFIQTTVTYEEIISLAFAIVREASTRVLGLRHYDVQLLGGLVLNDGKIAEMKTGEGKTIVAMLPSFFNALIKKGVHVITVNDYLSRRDAEFAGRVYKYLGISVGLIQETLTQKDRKKSYTCDIIYLTNKDLGYDYLRDNLVFDFIEVVQNSFSYCVVDEIDSILIDAAQIPILISEPNTDSTYKYAYCARISRALKRQRHYLVDEKKRTITILREGLEVCKQVLKLSDLYGTKDPWIPFILNSIKAKELVKRNTHYVISEKNEIVLVDDFTGRAIKGVKWGDGLHRAVEAKENMMVQSSAKTIACITYQNLFLLYKKLSGMTGTAISEKTEFETIYNLQSVVIPTHRPVQRKDFLDVVYFKQYLKWQAIAKACFDLYALGRPVLVGTTTIEKSELLAGLLTEYKILYRLLNAKPENVENESDIISQAGCFQAVTISTNMAGRGTDIILGGNAERLVKRQLIQYVKDLFDKPQQATFSSLERRKDYHCVKSFMDLLWSFPPKFFENRTNLALILDLIEGTTIPEKDSKLYELKVILEASIVNQRAIQKEKKVKVLNLGGLYVIGTERHESRRIDNQLRGRAGRQGDLGASRFFLSVEDRILRLFGGTQIIDFIDTFGFDPNIPFQSPIITQRLDTIQKRVESYYFDARKYLFEYDLVLSLQRNQVYSERKKVLNSSRIEKWLLEYYTRLTYDIFSFSSQLNKPKVKGFFLNSNLQKHLAMSYYFNLKETTLSSLEMVNPMVKSSFTLFKILLSSRVIEPQLIQSQILIFILQLLDGSWQDHLNALNSLKDSIGWRVYGQRNPLLEYKKESYTVFVKMLIKFRANLVISFLGLKVIMLDDSWILMRHSTTT